MSPATSPRLFGSDDLWALAALSGLPGMGPRRLRAVLAEYTPTDAWQAVEGGRLRLADGGRAHFGSKFNQFVASWSAHARLRPLDALLRRCDELGIDVIPFGADSYPERLRQDADPPMVLFARGDLGVLQADAVGV